jgi:hypothetical protein
LAPLDPETFHGDASEHDENDEAQQLRRLNAGAFGRGSMVAIAETFCISCALGTRASTHDPHVLQIVRT